MGWVTKVTPYALVLMLGCSGAFSTRPSNDTEPDGEAELEMRGDWPVVDQPGVPSGEVDLEQAWNRGDTAFLSGDVATAQYQFGLIYLIDPMHRGGQVQAALVETCRSAGNDCVLVLGRLDLLRLEWAETHGPRSSWVPQQENDFETILSCYDQALEGQLDEAYGTGYAVVNAPLPTFSRLARVCIERVDAIRTEIRMSEQIATATEVWDATIDEYQERYDAFYEAAQAADWEAIVNTYSSYKVIEEDITEVLQFGVLAADPLRAEAVATVEENVAYVAEWEEENMDEYYAMRDAVRLLDDNSEYDQALIQYESIYERIPPLLDEIESLEIALEATSGDEERSIERRIDANESEIREIRRDLRRIMVDINEIREEVGLESRDAPYGYED